MMGDSLLGSIQGLFGFFILLVGILIGWFSNEKIKKEEKMTESDAYVRDHLLIQWMEENWYRYFDPVTHTRVSSIELIYEKWMEWLKRMEEKHD